MFERILTKLWAFKYGIVIVGGVVLAVGAGRLYWVFVEISAEHAIEHARNTIFIVGGILGFVLAVWRGYVADKQADAAKKQADQHGEEVKALVTQAEIAERGQITERFTRAIEQLGKSGEERIFLRVGAIHGLKRIGFDSQSDVIAALELLACFVRATTPNNNGPKLATPALDVRTAISALSDLNKRYEDFLVQENVEINVSDSHLKTLIMTDACFARFNFSSCNFEDAVFKSCDFRNTTLESTRFIRCMLRNSQLAGSKISFANFDACFQLTTKMLEQVQYFENARPKNLPPGVDLPPPTARPSEGE